MGCISGDKSSSDFDQKSEKRTNERTFRSAKSFLRKRIGFREERGRISALGDRKGALEHEGRARKKGTKEGHEGTKHWFG